MIHSKIIYQDLDVEALNKANGESGSVKVMVKSTGVSYKPKEKKTGALSPRAPEKIKKKP
mgnify:CR=1 FL=1